MKRRKNGELNEELRRKESVYKEQKDQVKRAEIGFTKTRGIRKVKDMTSLVCVCVEASSCFHSENQNGHKNDGSIYADAPLLRTAKRRCWSMR